MLSTTNGVDGPAPPASLVEFRAVLLPILTPNVPSPVIFESVIVAVVLSPFVTTAVAFASPVLLSVTAASVKFTCVTSV